MWQTEPHQLNFHPSVEHTVSSIAHETPTAICQSLGHRVNNNILSKAGVLSDTFYGQKQTWVPNQWKQLSGKSEYSAIKDKYFFMAPEWQKREQDVLKTQSVGNVRCTSGHIYLSAILIQKDTALFTIAKLWKPPKRPRTDEWIKCGRYMQWNIYSVILNLCSGAREPQLLNPRGIQAHALWREVTAMRSLHTTTREESPLPQTRESPRVAIKTQNSHQSSSVTQSCPNSLRPHGLQHARLPCPSPAPGACSNSCSLSRWCHPTISSSAVLFSFCLQSFPASGSFLVSYKINK